MSRRVMFNGKVVKISLTRRERAPLCMAAVMLAMTWASETDASPRQARHLADTQQATTARDRGSDEFKTWPPPSGGSDKSIQIAQATTPHTGALQQPPEQQRDWAESLSCELAFARRDIALLQHFEQERDRADWLAQDLDAARREVETQKALVAKAVEEASRLKEASRPNRAGESGPAELQASLQEERERSVRLEQDLAAALRNVETQTALATKAGEETSRLKQAGESQAVELQKALQQESERTARLERDLAAARHDAETQTALATKADEETSRLKQAGESQAVELQKALQQESQRTARLEQDLAAARHDADTQTALATKAGEETSRLKQAEESQAVELQKALQQESQRTARLEQDLTAARQNVESQTALVAKANEAKEEMSQRSRAAEASAADLRQSMQKERERADTLAQDLSLTRSAIYAYQAQTALLAKPSEGPSRLKAAAGGDAVELQKFLQQERDRTGRLEQALEAAQRDIDAQTALAAKASDEVVRLTQAAKAGAAEQIRSIQKEHERADALAQDLSMARSKIYAYEAQAAKASEEAAQHKQTEASEVASLGQSLQRERERAEQLARDLAKAGRDLDAQTERASKASEEVLRIKQAGERDSAELRGLLQRERERAEGLETEIALARLDNGAFVAKHPSPASQPATTGKAMREPFAAPARQIQDQPVQEKPAQDKQVQDQAIVARSPGDARVNPDEAVQVARLIARASLLLEQGDIGAARIVLEHVAGMGSAQAIFVLAETYDPLILPSLGTYGTHGDATRARDLYARAEAGGIKEAKARFEALRR
ncbi:hypothetical protein [Bradyrhizobium diazoefficiens]|uniref:Blr6315 protein n=2 Tax=Bradyrhizobium diazoefficiens TaxID=1355477 RepID=Q89GN0_BRADU|nr:hypothetical protein [Bradyrhizobium diazoefficiens]AND91409.1 hypothetical protein AAV28_29140 [Bradyrhizobium diazoefficiens USDA 110]QBP25070.1 hypothetical protein Bdiaspc4_33300 [Bradyrhizobium diazoefficiens]QLD41966.1 hypothetical protein HUW42_13635 [Bradyrhizobium diazoefficiens]WLB36481.1 hypothetical protein QIH78_34160 [Bradyrhizobium diazoefficiens]WLC18518.1 hypothetical protein QIH76_09465 [Bradyrhizobium diazoefficiens]